MFEKISKSKPILADFIFSLFLATIITGLLTYTDIILHDYYAKPIIAECYAENQSDFCKDIRESHNLPTTAHIELGNLYWQVLQTQAIVLGITMFSIRIGMSKVMKRKIRSITLFVAILYGITVSMFFLSGWLDAFYYIGRGMEIPSSLPWLDSSGLFQFTKTFGNDKLHVESSDLYITMGIGFGVLFALWYFAMCIYKDERLRGTP